MDLHTFFLYENADVTITDYSYSSANMKLKEDYAAPTINEVWTELDSVTVAGEALDVTYAFFENKKQAFYLHREESTLKLSY